MPEPDSTTLHTLGESLSCTGWITLLWVSSLDSKKWRQRAKSALHGIFFLHGNKPPLNSAPMLICCDTLSNYSLRVVLADVHPLQIFRKNNSSPKCLGGKGVWVAQSVWMAFFCATAAPAWPTHVTEHVSQNLHLFLQFHHLCWHS